QGSFWRGGHFVTPLDAAEREAAPHQQQQQMVAGGGGVAEGGSSGGDTATKVCVCSPSSHPGSFKCRHHRVEYQWVSRGKPV
ncbi:hypothetical protein MIMGU_mgv1a018296mg, partial [Erythranthe guttata]